MVETSADSDELALQDDALVLNGIDVTTGTYLVPRLDLADVAAALRGDPSPAPGARELRRRRHDDEDHLGVAYGFDPQDLASVGWGVVVPEGLDPAILEALGPLLDHRQAEAGERFKRLDARPGESKDVLLARYGMGPGVADPRKVPYYLLLLGTPEQLSFELQYQLGVTYAVGRLDLPSPAAYAAYAADVVASEQPARTEQPAPAARSADDDDAAPAPAAAPAARRSLHLFATRHPVDTPTALSASRLVAPLAAELAGATASWEVTSDVGPGATRARLGDLVTTPAGPDILFTAGHGIAGSTTRPRAVTGALLCQDWPGPLARRGPVDEAHYLAADHLATGTPIRPRVVFSFACFGAGTPRLSDYPGAGPDVRPELADASFTAHLPQRLLGEPAGALAFVGHVDRVWQCSFLWKGATGQIAPFTSALLALMDGARLGFALESLTSRYAEVATELTQRLDSSRKYGLAISDADLVGLWTATHDARGYVVLGDPAVRVAPRGAAQLAPR